MLETVKPVLLIEPHYLPSNSWMQLAARYPEICFDLGEHHIKSSYRNRCHIAGPNGLLKMSVPLIHGKGQHLAGGKVKIAYETDWRKNHWMTLCSCYRRSAFFEFFEDTFAPVYEQRFEYLAELDIALIKIIFSILKLNPTISTSENYIEPGTEGYDDFRNHILPKIINPLQLKFPPYQQVFSDRFDFFEDLSAIDLIFNQGKYNFNP